ncbi:hypothetical protein [Yinghuangia sp. YIM S10712]
MAVMWTEHPPQLHAGRPLEHPERDQDINTVDPGCLPRLPNP